MRRALAILAGLLLAGGAQAADGWASLWRTPDQRGDQLLRQGDPAAAASTYSDPRRKAYAELQAGDAAAAARDFAGLDDGDAHYNRGNALARSGDLKQALEAFDAALVRDPGNRDARHNRDLVAQALDRQQQQQAQENSQQNQSQNQSQNQQQNQQDQQQKSAEGGQASSGQGADQKSGSKEPSGKPADAKDPQQAGSRSDDDAGKQDDAAGSPDPSKADRGRPEAPQDPQHAADDAAQAQREAAERLRKPAQGPAAGVDTAHANDAPPPSPGKGEPMASMPPGTEAQLAQEQWLRRIPDDPGGLLRRKFLIEHRLREQNPPR